MAFGATSLDLGEPVKLLTTRILGGGQDNPRGRQYDVAADGRFLINTVLSEVSGPIIMIQNWRPEN